MVILLLSYLHFLCTLNPRLPPHMSLHALLRKYKTQKSISGPRRKEQEKKNLWLDFLRQPTLRCLRVVQCAQHGGR
jgi:uncharacterized protein YktA (UPF0223 family)